MARERKDFNVWKFLFFLLAAAVLLFQSFQFYGRPNFDMGFTNGHKLDFAQKRAGHAIQLKPDDFWIETASSDPRILILHNLVSKADCEHLKALGVEKGLERAKILPYGSNELVESQARTNTGAWLDFQQDEVVRRLENKIAEVTGTHVNQGESVQILRYEPSQQFKEHHDFFDPETDPPENFEPGGNRMATVVLYLHAAESGGETLFTTINMKLTAKTGDAILFYDMKPDGTVDRNTMHAGMPPIKGEKWVASKWIHQRAYQVNPATQDVQSVGSESEGPAESDADGSGASDSSLGDDGDSP